MKILEPGESAPPLNGDVDDDVLNPAIDVMNEDNITFTPRRAFPGVWPCVISCVLGLPQADLVVADRGPLGFACPGSPFGPKLSMNGRPVRVNCITLTVCLKPVQVVSKP